MIQMTLRYHKVRDTILILLLLAATPAFSMSVKVLDGCDVETNENSLYIVLGKGENKLSAWSHIANPQYEKEFSNLGSTSTLNLKSDGYVQDPICNDVFVQNTILVVKLSDWTRQHSTGLEAQFAPHNVRFGDVAHVLMDVRLNSLDTRVLSAEQLKHRYSDYVSVQQLTEVDQGKVNLGITLFGDGALDQSSESFNSESIIEIDQSLLFDKWLRVIIPLSDFQSFKQKDYQNSSVDIKEFSRESIQGIRINAETSQGKQLRNVMDEQWTVDIPENFKQISISFRAIELLANPLK